MEVPNLCALHIPLTFPSLWLSVSVLTLSFQLDCKYFGNKDQDSGTPHALPDFGQL